MSDHRQTLDEVVRRLNLQSHPEGGYYREIYRDVPSTGTRGSVTSIYYALGAGQVSAWHRVDATEIWHYYAGAPLLLKISEEESGTISETRLGNVLSGDQVPQAVVPPNAWQSAVSEGAWSLVGCTVSPAFEFSGFELAPEGWSPDQD